MNQDNAYYGGNFKTLPQVNVYKEMCAVKYGSTVYGFRNLL